MIMKLHTVFFQNKQTPIMKRTSFVRHNLTKGVHFTRKRSFLLKYIHIRYNSHAMRLYEIGSYKFHYSLYILNFFYCLSLTGSCPCHLVLYSIISHPLLILINTTQFAHPSVFPLHHKEYHSYHGQ